MKLTFYLYAAVPQARKASLARFLEKRKERLVYTWFLYLHKKNGYYYSLVKCHHHLTVQTC